MIEDKLSKLNETIPEANRSINKRDEIYQSVKNKKTQFKSFFDYKKIMLISISCILVIILSISIINNYKIKGSYSSLDIFFENNENCERINYEEWMEENIIKENVGQGDIAQPDKTVSALFGDGIYDVSYSNDKGFYFVVYIDTDKVEEILTMSGCMGLIINVKEIFRISGSIKVNYKELNEDLLYVKCKDVNKIPAYIESFYPVQVFYMHEITVKEELLSSTILNKKMFFSTTVSFEKSGGQYLVPSIIPGGSISVEDTLPGKNAIVISNDLKTIENSTIMNTLYYDSPQLFYDEYIIFKEYGFSYYNYFYDDEEVLRKNLTSEMASYLTMLKNNKGSSMIGNHKYYYLVDSFKGLTYYTVNTYNDINDYTYLKTNDYKNMLRQLGKKEIINFSYKESISDIDYSIEKFSYTYKIISTYEEFIEVAKALELKYKEYDKEFFETKSICFVPCYIDAKAIVRNQSIIYIEGDYIQNEVPSLNIYFTMEFNKSDIDESDYLMYHIKPIGKIG